MTSCAFSSLLSWMPLMSGGSTWWSISGLGWLLTNMLVVFTDVDLDLMSRDGIDTIVLIYWETNLLNTFWDRILSLLLLSSSWWASVVLYCQLYHYHLGQELLLVQWLSHRASVHQIPAAMFTDIDCSLYRHIPKSFPPIVDKAVESVPLAVDQEALRHLLCRKGNWSVKAQVENFWPVA